MPAAEEHMGRGQGAGGRGQSTSHDRAASSSTRVRAWRGRESTSAGARNASHADGDPSACGRRRLFGSRQHLWCRGARRPHGGQQGEKEEGAALTPPHGPSVRQARLQLPRTPTRGCHCADLIDCSRALAVPTRDVQKRRCT